jgi:methylmalonyl-CoA mutase cobalamin-binding domain/chain
MAEGRKRLRILMAKPGQEGHWTGLVVVSKALRDAGYEVIYAGNMTPQGIAAATVQEDAEAVGLSILSANYLQLVSEVIAELRKVGKADVKVLLGGIILRQDFDKLRQMGVTGIFPSGTPLPEIVQAVREKVGSPA